MTARFAELGYTADVAASQKLRSAAQFPWFKSNLFAMRRNVALTTRRPGPGERERQTDTQRHAGAEHQLHELVGALSTSRDA